MPRRMGSANGTIIIENPVSGEYYRGSKFNIWTSNKDSARKVTLAESNIIVRKLTRQGFKCKVYHVG